jgi:hypothetical protein
MGERQAKRLVIYIDPQKARDLDRDLTLQKLYYRPKGYYQTAEKMQTACKKARYKLQFLNEVHQSDTTPMPHDKVGNQIYKYRGVIKDVATRYRRSFALTDKSSAQMAKAIQKIYNDPNDPFNLPEEFIVDRSTEYMGKCKDLLLSYNVKIQYANSKHGVAIAECDH